MFLACVAGYQPAVPSEAPGVHCSGLGHRSRALPLRRGEDRILTSPDLAERRLPGMAVDLESAAAEGGYRLPSGRRQPCWS